MRTIRCLLGLGVLLAVLLEAARGKTCHSSDQCRLDECCVTKSSYLGGCRSKGCKGCSCLPESVKSGVGDMYLMSCPCSSDLVCVPTAIIEKGEDRTVEYLNSTCQTTEVLLNLYKRLLESKKFHPRLLSSIFSKYSK